MDSISRISAKDSLRSYYSEDFCGIDSPPPPVKGDASRYKQQDKKVKEQAQEQSDAVPRYTLSLTTITESENLAFGSVHKIWSMLRIDAADRSKMIKTVTQVDFVVVIDHSASMKMNNKLAFVQATIEYLISKLNEAHRFCLIKFNQEVSLVTNGLLTMTNDNKEKVRALLHDIKPQGTTNISDALFTAIGILANRNHEEQSRISSIMLFTDGLSNAGLRGKGFMDAMKDMIIPAGLTINTFGYGLDHDSKMLQNISFASKGGVYYYIESSKSIPATFGECLAGILSTVSHNIEVRLIAQDGCRIVNFYTKFPIKELKSVKEYGISIGSMYSQECRTVLFKLSLRKMDQEIALQPLVRVIISYTNTLTGVDHKTETSIVVGRPAVVPPQRIPIELDKQINRYTAAAAIEEAIKKASTRDFHGAQSQLKEVIDIVQTSASAKDPSSRVYCEDLVEDLRECSVGMENMESFSSGIHYAHAYSTMYYMERSTGSTNLMGVKKSVESTQLEQQQIIQETEDDLKKKKKRNHGYGYVTCEQEEEASQAVKQTAIFVTGYLDNALM